MFCMTSPEAQASRITPAGRVLPECGYADRAWFLGNQPTKREATP